MDIITDNFKGISLVQLQNKLSEKYEQLQQIKMEKRLKAFSKKDYIEQTQSDTNNDQDFAKVLKQLKNKNKFS